MPSPNNNNNNNVTNIVGNIGKSAHEFASNTPVSRNSLIEIAQELIANLELPSESIQRIGWAEPARAAHCRIAVELGIFEHLKDRGENGASAKSLAIEVKAEFSLIARILKYLSSMHVIKEKSAGYYTPTTFSNALVETKFKGGIIYTYNVAGPSFAGLPQYLKSNGYINPIELSNGPFQYAHKTQMPFFAWLDKNPPYLAIFNSYMSAYRAGKPTWCDAGFFPIEKLTTGFDPTIGSALLVDVGGGLGHDLQALRQKHPDLPGDLILQDREGFISTLPKITNSQAIAHDFFTPQSVLQARAYYLHSVLHDWGDEACVKILENLKPALNATLSSTSMDQLMLVLGAMKERTEKQWREILVEAGYRVLKFWSYPGVAESVIEAVLEGSNMPQTPF